MNRLNTLRAFLSIATLAVLLPALPAAAQAPRDVVTVATVTGSPGSVVDVPVYVRDVSGTPLGIDQPFGSRIQSFSLKVDYSPTAPVTAVTFTRAGLTAPLTPAFESNPTVVGSTSLLMNFNETTNLVPFTSNAPAPGNLIGHLQVTLSGSVTPGTTITLALDPLLTQLTDAGGNFATAETAGNSRLTLVNGQITVASTVPTVSQWGLLLIAVSLAVLALRRWA
jgi:hypothetical protein